MLELPAIALSDARNNMQVPRLHGVTALCWSPEGSSFALGTLSGCVMLYSTCLKCMLYKNTFEITQSTFSTANIRHLMTGSRSDKVLPEFLSLLSFQVPVLAVRFLETIECAWSA